LVGIYVHAYISLLLQACTYGIYFEQLICFFRELPLTVLCSMALVNDLKREDGTPSYTSRKPRSLARPCNSIESRPVTKSGKASLYEPSQQHANLLQITRTSTRSEPSSRQASQPEPQESHQASHQVSHPSRQASRSSHQASHVTLQ